MTARTNYSSGDDIVLERGGQRFTFSERDFAERCETAARRLSFLAGPLDGAERDDLVALAVDGEVAEPQSALGEHVNDCWPDLVGPPTQSIVHWLRRLVFDTAWLDQRVKDGELGVAFHESTGAFAYVRPDRRDEPVELSVQPSWGRVAYTPR